MGRVTDYASLDVCNKCDIYYAPDVGHEWAEEK